jgi:hypothetical protein
MLSDGDSQIMDDDSPVSRADESDPRAPTHASGTESTTFSIPDMIDIANHMTLSDMSVCCESVVNDIELIERRLWVIRRLVTGERRTFLLCRHGRDIRIILWEPERLFVAKLMQIFDCRTSVDAFQRICEWSIA